MKKLFARFAQDESGATAIEYGLIAAGISVAIITVTSGLGSKLNTTFTSVQDRAQVRPRPARGSWKGPDCSSGLFLLRRRVKDLGIKRRF